MTKKDVLHWYGQHLKNYLKRWKKLLWPAPGCTSTNKLVTIHNKGGLSFKVPSSTVSMVKVKISIVFWCGKKVTVIAASKASKRRKEKKGFLLTKLAQFNKRKRKSFGNYSPKFNISTVSIKFFNLSTDCSHRRTPVRIPLKAKIYMVAICTRYLVCMYFDVHNKNILWRQTLYNSW